MHGGSMYLKYLKECEIESEFTNNTYMQIKYVPDENFLGIFQIIFQNFYIKKINFKIFHNLYNFYKILKFFYMN